MCLLLGPRKNRAFLAASRVMQPPPALPPLAGALYNPDRLERYQINSRAHLVAAEALHPNALAEAYHARGGDFSSTHPPRPL